MTADRPDLLLLLRAHDFGAVHAHLGAVQAQFEAGHVGERELLDTFAPFMTSDLTLGEGLRAWMAAHPDEYAPHVALAEWFLGRGWEARGQQTSNRVSDQGWRALEHFLDQAETCARHAATLTANPLAAWIVVGRVHSTRGCDLTLEDVQAQAYPEWFTRGVEINPRSFALRRTMLLLMRTEWGGSEEHMLTFLRQQQDAGQMSATDMQRLWAQFHAFMSHHALHFANDPARGVERARAAADLHPAQAEQLFIALTKAKAPTAERHGALRLYLTAAEQDPGITPGGNFAWALHHSGEWARPEAARIGALLARSARGGDANAAVMLGRLHVTHRTWDLPDALPLLRAARDQGHTEAAETIVHLHRVTGADEALRRDDILKAANLLSGPMSWEVYRHFVDYQRQFDLDARQRYVYLHRAADAGENDARRELAAQLRAGRVELGGDHVLRPVDTAPIQESLDYARHLLERASGSGDRDAARELRAARDRDWNAATARRLRDTPTPARSRPTVRVPWFLLIFAVIGIVRACAPETSSAPRTAQEYLRQYGEQGGADSERMKLIERVAAGDLTPVLEGDHVRFVPSGPK